MSDRPGGLSHAGQPVVCTHPPHTHTHPPHTHTHPVNLSMFLQRVIFTPGLIRFDWCVHQHRAGLLKVPPYCWSNQSTRKTVLQQTICFDVVIGRCSSNRGRGLHLSFVFFFLLYKQYPVDKPNVKIKVCHTLGLYLRQ